MALNILEFPALLCHSDNPIPLHIEAGIDWQNPIPAQDWGYWILFSTDLVIPGEKITIVLGGVEYEIEMLSTGATIPDNGLGVEENPGIDPIDNWLNSFFIPTVNQNYTIANNVTFVAAPGVLFINAPYETFLSVTTDIAGATAAVVATGIPAIYPENYHILVDVLVASAKVAKLKAIPEKSSPYAAKFDLSSIVKSYLSSQLPTFTLLGLEECTTALVALDFVCTEGWGSPVQYKGLTDNSTPLLVLKGGVPFESFPALGPTAPLSMSPRRSNTPTTKPTTVQAPEYIYFCYIFSLFDTSTPIEITGTIYYTDGSSQNETWLSDTINNFKEYIFASGYEALNIGTFQPTKTVDKWTVKIVSTEYGTIIDTLTYQLPARKPYNVRCFLYENSLNGFDTLCSTTNAVVGIQVSKEEFSAALEWDYTARQGETAIFNLQARKRVRVSTGWASYEYIKSLHDFVISQRIYEVGEDDYLPVQIVANSFQLYKEDDRLYSLEFEYEYLFNANKHLNA